MWAESRQTCRTERSCKTLITALKYTPIIILLLVTGTLWHNMWSKLQRWIPSRIDWTSTGRIWAFKAQAASSAHQHFRGASFYFAQRVSTFLKIDLTSFIVLNFSHSKVYHSPNVTVPILYTITLQTLVSKVIFHFQVPRPPLVMGQHQFNINTIYRRFFFTAQCTLKSFVQSAVLRSHIVRLTVTLVDCEFVIP